MTTVVSPVVAHLGEDFLTQVYGRTYRHFPGEPGRFDGLLGWGDLNALLTHHRLEPPRLRLSMGGEALPQHAYTVPVTTRRNTVWHQLKPSELHRHLADGATLVLDAVDELHPGVGELAQQLERHLRTGIQVNAYASWTPEEGFGVHWDDHDVIALQIGGAKRWRVYGPTRQAPLHRDTDLPEPPPDEPLVELVLNAGDMLYLPRGWWHAVAASEGVHSLHLTCGMQTTTGVDLLRWISEDLRREICVRSDLPRFGTEEEKAEFVRTLGDLLMKEFGDDGLLDRYLSVRDATERSRLAPSLPYVEGVPPDPGLVVRLVTSRARLSRDAEGNAVLVAGGEEWTFASGTEPLLSLLVGGGAYRLDVLARAAGIRVGQAALLVSQLIDGELAAVEKTS
ncbi:cupin domain-containing protein [Streptomyces sp. NTK 937]|uniref:cupin domain-containing protein n=1 Tax=Streptomyces TaxID=1883 RepID=UPI0004A8B924|nr:cupin domain-containing protein [Streptomyces sp. NTK 937]KDQ68180.1 cupin [Streptomyces sp. NTK 937]WSX37304.1 cupin domain-containing protein [Streptomyces halstedii]